MENIRNFFEGEDLNACIEAISNKLLLLPVENQKLYANILLQEINDQILDHQSSLEDFEISRSPDNEPSIDEEYIAYNNFRIDLYVFVSRINNLFQLCGIDLIKQTQDLNCNAVKKYIDKNNLIDLEIYNNQKKKCIKATMLQSWTVIRNLMECAVGWRLTNNDNKLMYNKKDVAKFIAFLCGGSEERIRKHLEDELPAKEMRTILPYLDNIGLQKVSERIKNDVK